MQVLSHLVADDQHPRRGHHRLLVSLLATVAADGRGLPEGPKQAPQQRPSLEVPLSKPGSGFGPESFPVPAVRVGVLGAACPEREVSPNAAVTAVFMYAQNVCHTCTHSHYHRPRDNKAPQECCVLVHNVFYLT